MGGGSWLTGEFLMMFGSGGIGAVLVAWLNGRSGRKVRLKVGELEAEAPSVKELDALLERAKDIQNRRLDDDSS
jgi:hypothetical protein